MSGHSSGEWLLLFCTALVVIVRVFYLVRRFWNLPLNHGPGFFLGIEVAAGFYSGEGVGWLKRYRTAIVAEYLVEALALVAILVWGRWDLLPVWAGGMAVLAVAVLFGFNAYTRSKLGANPPVRSSAAISLEARRLGNYIWWPGEALMAVVIALSWALLLRHGDVQVQWGIPVTFTYIIVGLLPFKIGIVRKSFPLPAERTEEHYRWMEAQRRQSLLEMDGFFRWFSIVILAGYALQHGWPGARAVVWLRWILIGTALAVWLASVAILIRGSGRLAAMGHDLRPVGSWAGPFRPASLMLPGLAPWFAAWCGGLLLLLVFFLR